MIYLDQCINHYSAKSFRQRDGYRENDKASHRITANIADFYLSPDVREMIDARLSTHYCDKDQKSNINSLRMTPWP